ncbi:CobW family GTP-binding protein [Stutzerimonas nitrititolerans]|uniref:CobW family GTP-binding protein n=1 Tax=Stutzerimonas nitrititolerans TaxID=2482751 RepID=UPI0028AD17DF|nr:CobW family GTP-binding protein [Stutzerimonas nitrititolerans]
MLNDIPTHLIAGPLGAGKTSLIRALLAQKPAGERWAVLINEFGQIGLDAALLHRDEAGVSFAEVAGGCLCCVNGVPFQIGLSQLLRKARPDRLLIEPSGLGHPLELLQQLRQPPWQQVLALQAPVMLLDATALAGGAALTPSQQALAAEAGLLVLNKCEGLDEAARTGVLERLPPRPRYWTEHGQLDLARLPGIDARARAATTAQLPPPGAAPLASIWLDPLQPIVLSHAAAEGWSIGWRWHPARRFDIDQVTDWLAQLPWRRAKLVLHGAQGWVSANGLDGAPLALRTSEWRRDSRLELIFAEAQEEQALISGLEGCLIGTEREDRPSDGR